jgi:hypothetical protein
MTGAGDGCHVREQWVMLQDIHRKQDTAYDQGNGSQYQKKRQALANFCWPDDAPGLLHARGLLAL